MANSSNPRNLPVLYVPGGEGNKLPDKGQWVNRFEVRSQTSDRVYIVAQHRDKRFWACSCPGWIIHRTCKHLQAMQLPCFERPHEVLMG